MKKVNLRTANQEFSKLVRTVQETGETFEILRNGQPAAQLGPVPGSTGLRKLTVAQQAAVKSLVDTSHRVRGKSDGRKMTRDEMHER